MLLMQVNLGEVRVRRRRVAYCTMNQFLVRLKKSIIKNFSAEQATHFPALPEFAKGGVYRLP